MRTRTNILFCFFTVMWLVMQVIVPAYHHHGGKVVPSCAGAQWQSGQSDQHECYICHLNHSPANVTFSNGELVPVLEPPSPIVFISNLYSSESILTPHVRAPPVA